MLVGLALLAPFAVLITTPLGKQVRDVPILRFGFSGPPRYIELMQVDSQPFDLNQPRNLGRVVPQHGLRGAAGKRAMTVSSEGKIVPGKSPGDLGQAGDDLIARAIANPGHVPVMQSSDLVIETLQRPEYPEDARNRGIEGHVAVLARVDTMGTVAEAQIMTPSGEPSFDQASKEAVMRCRFRPYHQDGKVTEVYAVFRFAFKIY